jgi:anti-anti-sigma factor
MEISRQGKGVLRVKGDLHISEAGELRSTLLDELGAVPALALDLSEVDGCDTASFQLLYSLRKSAERDGKELRISVPSATMHEASAILGISLDGMTFIPAAGKTEVSEV